MVSSSLTPATILTRAIYVGLGPDGEDVFVGAMVLAPTNKCACDRTNVGNRGIAPGQEGLAPGQAGAAPLCTGVS
jgi:hypothetical protein